MWSLFLRHVVMVVLVFNMFADTIATEYKEAVGRAG
jgi:hypothetical protein